MEYLLNFIVYTLAFLVVHAIVYRKERKQAAKEQERMSEIKEECRRLLSEVEERNDLYRQIIKKQNENKSELL